jgi:hypothetical protein
MMVRAGLTTLLAGLVLAASNVTASAATGTGCSYSRLDNGTYGCVIPGQPASTPPPAATGGVNVPLCDLNTPTVEPGARLYCMGTTACYDSTSVAFLNPPDAATQPTPDTKWHTRLCMTNGSWDSTAQWDGQAAEPTLAVQAIEAIGKISLPTPTLRFNPTNRTLVNLQTWFWAENLTPKVLQGSSAFGLIAYATPHGLEVNPGDGSGAFPCTWVTTRSDSCAYPYRRSSLGGSALGLDGRPAYPATVTATWTLTFEVRGVPTLVPDAPLTLDTPVASAAVVVDEVQTIVTSTG